jgi:hypothetical protein
MSPEMPVARLCECRNLDLRAQAEVLNALRSDTPTGFVRWSLKLDLLLA